MEVDVKLIKDSLDAARPALLWEGTYNIDPGQKDMKCRIILNRGNHFIIETQLNTDTMGAWFWEQIDEALYEPILICFLISCLKELAK